MDKLELLPAFRKRFNDDLFPYVTSVLLCQTKHLVFAEVLFSFSRHAKRVDFGFMGGTVTEDENGEFIDPGPLFKPEADIIDNAQILITLDDYELIFLLDIILKPQAVERICEEFNKR